LKDMEGRKEIQSMPPGVFFGTEAQRVEMQRDRRKWIWYETGTEMVEEWREGRLCAVESRNGTQVMVEVGRWSGRRGAESVRTRIECTSASV